MPNEAPPDEDQPLGKLNMKPNEENAPTHTLLMELTADVVAAYVGNNSVPRDDLPELIRNIHSALDKVDTSGKPVIEERPKPAVNPKRSVKPDHIVCLEDGKRFKSLKRHLTSTHGITPEEYRDRWGLASNYPMVAPDYAAERSKLAKKLGLGRKPTPKPKPMRQAKRK